MPQGITLKPTAEGDKAALVAQGRTAWQNDLIHDLLDALIKAQKDEYTPLPSRYPVDKKGNLLPNRERNLVEDRLLKRLKINRNAEKELANKVYADVDERFRPYIEGLKGQTQKVRELLSKDRNIQSIREGIAADEQELNYLSNLHQLAHDAMNTYNPNLVNDRIKLGNQLKQELPGKQQALKESLEKKRQYLQDYENASSAFSQEIPEIYDFPKVYADVDERFRPYIEGLKGQTQKVRELLSNDRNIQSIREGIAADEQNINLLRKAAQQFHSTSEYIAGTPVSPQLTANAKEIEERLNYLTDSLEKKRQYLQDYENASSAFSQEIPEIYDLPSKSLGSEFLASESMSDPLVQQAVKDDGDIAKDAIKDVLQGPSARRNAFLDKLEAGGENTLPAASQISDYLFDRNQRAASAILNEMNENYLTNILPKGNLGFMSGAWNSPQRGTHQQSLLRNLRKDAFNTLMKMEADNTKAGLAEAGEQQKRGLFSGQLGSEALNKGIETQVGAAQGLANIEKAQAAEEFGGLEALARIGQEKQQAEENRLLEMQKEFQKQQNRPVENILQAYNAAQNIPNQTMTDMFIQQQQPNYSAIGGYGLGNIATAMMMPAMGYQGRKAGGLVQKFADGGIALPGVPDDQYRQMLEEEAQQMAGTKVQEVNPMASALAKMTDAMAQRYTGMTPIAGSLVDSYEQRAKSQEVNKIRGLNLMQQIHASRIKQQEFLAEMDYKNRKLKSDESQHYATLGETSRHHRTLEGIKERKLTAKDNPKFEHQEQAKQHYKSEQELKNKFLEHQEDNQKARDMIDSMESSYKKGIGPTGPIMGHTPDILIKNKKLANRQNVMGEAAEELFKILGKQKGVQSDKDMAEMRKTLPNEYSPDERWKEWFAKGRKMVERGDRYSEFINQAEAEGLSRYEAQKMWNAQLKEESKQASGDVQIRDPEGNIRLIPASKVDEALQAGGQRV
jgi:hypothetical protein